MRRGAGPLARPGSPVLGPRLPPCTAPPESKVAHPFSTLFALSIAIKPKETGFAGQRVCEGREMPRPLPPPGLPLNRHHATGLTLKILTAVVGRSLASVCTLPRRLTTPMPAHTRPKMVCLPSRNGVGARVMKNWEPGGLFWGRSQVGQATAGHHTALRPTHQPPAAPLVLGPALAMLSTPAPVWWRSPLISSSNLPPYTDSPPRPVPVGSPPWIIKSCRVFVCVRGAEGVGMRPTCAHRPNAAWHASANRPQTPKENMP